MSGFWPPFPPASPTSSIFHPPQMWPMFTQIESLSLAGDYGLSIITVMVLVVIVI